ncbi:LysR family transcriptional regulator [Mesorhizobium sp. M4B.F.Ca.ET.089.01.1.1]|uniref:LysR family transcriptional regulator n=1 Tax=Mesorhizobium sp. M4B.F.Ca.ET.089.01.1.1 TaxID=2496662 RepID=UPI001FE1818C|nr:LysR family transcriptional regulator [Mesorhizobium sp. M4B.F.Ca.ET.089.01.1.1]
MNLIAGSLEGALAFVQAVDAGSFTAAAARLRLTKSAVGRKVLQLEQRLGVRLLNRTTRRLSLTADGEIYYEACRRALAGLSEAQDVIAAGRQAPAGVVRLALPLAFGRRWVAPVLFGLAKDHPALRLEIGFDDHRSDLVDDGIDLAVRLGPLADNASLTARRLGTQRSLLCASPAYLATAGTPADIQGLAQHALLVYGRRDFINPWPLPDGNGTMLYQPQARLMIGDGDALLQAAVAGCGIAFLPDWLAGNSLRRGELVPVLMSSAVDTAPHPPAVERRPRRTAAHARDHRCIGRSRRLAARAVMSCRYGGSLRL